MVARRRTETSIRPLYPPEERPKFRSRPHDMQNLHVSLKQWRILHAVVDCGGFAEAAKSLHLSQSTVSYTVAKLQEQLGVPLLRIAGRKAMLTSEGRALLDRSRRILKEALELESFARDLGSGWGEEVQVVFDHHFPVCYLMRALSRFSALGSCMANVRLREMATLQAEEVLRDHRVDLAIGAHVPLGLFGEPLLEVEFVAVAHPAHPLLKLGRELAAVDLAQQVRIEVGHTVLPGLGRSGEHPQVRRWAMGSFETAIGALREGHGYAWLPLHSVRGWLEQGLLAHLPLRDKSVRKTMLYLMSGHPWTPSPAVSRFVSMLREVIAEEAGVVLTLQPEPIQAAG